MENSDVNFQLEWKSIISITTKNFDIGFALERSDRSANFFSTFKTQPIENVQIVDAMKNTALVIRAQFYRITEN